MASELKIRCFLALPLARAFEDDISPLINDLRQRCPTGIQWVAPKEVHLTLHFFGRIEESRISVIGEAVSNLISRENPFEFFLEEIGGFPNLVRPRVIWIGMGGEIDRLGRFRQSLEVSLEGKGFVREERPFKAHLTVGRQRVPQTLRGLERYKFGPTLRRTICEAILFRSHITPQGSHYERIQTFNFAKA